MISLIERTKLFPNRIAIISEDRQYTYKELLEESVKIASFLLKNNNDLNEARIAFLVPASFYYTAVEWGIWIAGGIAVPLCEKHPLPSIQYVLEDTSASKIIYTEEFEELLRPIIESEKDRFVLLDDIASEHRELPEINSSRRAMILYTSGTTGLPKGVVTTHRNIETQIRTLVDYWKWEADDHILNFLPLHHVHGIINVMSCALWSGAICEFMPKFDAQKVFDIILKGKINVFMAVPTIYFKLIAQYKELTQAEQQLISEKMKLFRLMVSGSAALPVSVLEEWRSISGHTLLERYGMTEIGMAVSNPYHGERRPGHIGHPLPGVSIKIFDEDGNEVMDGEPGEIHVKGDNVFIEYWGKPGATKEAFTEDGWFRTGDIAEVNDGYIRIIGRNSVDIIKSGGYKISALEIEEVLRKYEAIADCGVIGIPDDEWGEIIGASIILEKSATIDIDELKEWLKNQLPGYKLPRKYIIQEELPRNVMGKVTKKALLEYFV